MSSPHLRQLSYIAPLLTAVGLLGRPSSLSAQHYESLTWTPDGRALVVSVGGNLYTLALDGAGSRRLDRSDARDVYLSWAPDGSAMIFASDRDGDSEIFRARGDGSEAVALTRNELDDSYPSWSPDGTQIAFMRREDGHWRLWRMRADGTEERRLGSEHDEGNDYNPGWAPDGRRIVFETSRHEGDQDEIYVLDVADGTEHRLTATPGNDVYPDWSPDGSRIAYCTIADGSAQISVISPDGGEPRRWIEDACFPRWSPDGTSLAYVAFGPDRSERLWVLRLGTDERFEVPGPGDHH